MRNGAKHCASFNLHQLEDNHMKFKIRGGVSFILANRKVLKEGIVDDSNLLVSGKNRTNIDHQMWKLEHIAGPKKTVTDMSNAKKAVIPNAESKPVDPKKEGEANAESKPVSAGAKPNDKPQPGVDKK